MPYRIQAVNESEFPTVEENPVILELEKIQASTRAVRQILETLHRQNLTVAHENSKDIFNEPAMIAANRPRLKEILLNESLLNREIVAEIYNIFGQDSEIYKKMVRAKSGEISAETIEIFLDNLTIASLGLETRGQVLLAAGNQLLVNPDNNIQYVMTLLGKKEMSEKIIASLTAGLLGLILMVSKSVVDDANIKSLLLTISIVLLIIFTGTMLSVSHLDYKKSKLKDLIYEKLKHGQNVLTDAQFSQLKSELQVQLNEWEKFIGADKKVKKPTQISSAKTSKLRVPVIIEEFTPQPTETNTSAEIESDEASEQTPKVLKKLL